MAVLRGQGEELGQGQARLKALLGRVKQEEQELDRGITILEQKKVGEQE